MVGWVVCEHSAHRALDLEVGKTNLECKKEHGEVDAWFWIEMTMYRPSMVVF